MLLRHGKQEEKKGAIARNRKFHNEKYTQNNNTKTMLCDHSESVPKQVFGYAEMRILIAANVSNVDFVFLTFLRCLPNCDELWSVGYCDENFSDIEAFNRSPSLFAFN
jgi:hypothetical protein